MQNIVRDASLVKSERDDEDDFETHARMLLSLGLVRKVPRTGGMAYEITDIGRRFVEGYESIESNRALGSFIGPAETSRRVFGLKEYEHGKYVIVEDPKRIQSFLED